ncbi:MAG: glycosyltransferase [Candidatus Paceibacterota bacterium]|jgi:alpha-N-acetylglucosamine transferase
MEPFLKENYSFVSIITTDDYLPGLLVLYRSLIATNTRYSFLVLLTEDISTDTISILERQHIPYKIVKTKINNPTDIDHGHRWFPTYSKLNVFDQTQYNKIVYLDADMLILRNIDELFKYSHMSATNAGSMLPKKQDRRHLNLNSGLIVIQPSQLLFNDMISKIGKIEGLESGGGDRPIHGSDQDFINAYFPEWPDRKELHLDHKYNIFHYHLDEYNKLFGYTIEDGPKPISIVHYASYLKPWNIKSDEINKMVNNQDKHLELRAIQLWIDRFNNINP